MQTAEHPILFKQDMVKAILGGKKIMTRRVLNPQPTKITSEEPPLWFGRMERSTGDIIGKVWHCPYGVPGDRLWVKETFARMCRAATPDCPCETEAEVRKNHYFEYKADSGNPYPGDWPADEAKSYDEAPKWRSSMMMPRQASRITLEVADIRVERIKEISLEDIESEGTPAVPAEIQSSYRNDGYQRYKDFQYLWDSINADRGFGWDVNPYVWVIAFKVLEIKK